MKARTLRHIVCGLVHRRNPHRIVSRSNKPVAGSFPGHGSGQAAAGGFGIGGNFQGAQI